eukprot:TRINITY_DN1812_c0_g1_i1.p1 TRINITY_DN1812_c0_g1~~TRINITY_DN1812_c0_g1_i1.p1  ORF type:complete len:1611 (+),score=575.78 TRINITY_DN1812_c0_g1_i1:62-4894(+)
MDRSDIKKDKRNAPLKPSKPEKPKKDFVPAKYKISKGEKVWVAIPEDVREKQNSTECFEIARVRDYLAEELLFSVFDEESYRQWKAKEDEVFPLNPANMIGVDDNTSMMHLHDPNLLQNLRHRYENNQIYTYTAYILIAINPYKRLPDLYNDASIKNYSGKSIGTLPPHVYAIADRAYRNMKGSGKNQSIVVSGESGAGKTETCKFVMRFFAVIAGQSQDGQTAVDESELLETKILQANPILEAFGNAKTLRNNNSSRFGKFTELHFDKNARLVGATIVTYLLEKSRLVSQARGERNFHVFYQLLAGATKTEQAKWHLQSPESYNYLKNSGCVTVDGVDDAEEFQHLRKAMKSCGMNEETQGNILSMLAGLLHLGNIEFSPIKSDVKKKESKDEPNYSIDEKVKVSDASASSLEYAANLLGLKADLLKERLVSRTLTIGGGPTGSLRPSKLAKENTYTIQLNEQEAIYARDALAKFIYSALFDWIVSKINRNIPCKNSSNFIGILDISGFEIFDNNSFEQFCINFANEKIQQYFNKQILSQEQEIYLLEGLAWRRVEYQDNQVVIDLVDQKSHGLFAILDEESIMPKATDKSFCAKVHTKHATSSHLSIPSISKKTKQSRRLHKDEGFVLSHFAGQVCYNTKGFLDKNNDSLHNDLSQLLYNGQTKFLGELFQQDKDEDGVVVNESSNRRFKSASARFQKQLTHLMAELNSTVSHFIRCIKPNEFQKPEIFNSASVMTQLRYNGMCTALELMQIGYPTRISFDELYTKYSPYMPLVISRLRPVTFCEALLVALDLHGGKDFQMGLTKVFFRAGKLQFLDELTSNSKDVMNGIIGKVKKWLARKRFMAAIAAVRSLIRLEKQILSIRRIHRFRRAGRFMLRMVQVWIALVPKIRKKMLTSEAYKKKMEEEARRKEEERMVEQRRKEEEERIKRERKEAKAKAKAEEKANLESRIVSEENSRKNAEKELKDLNEKMARLGSEMSDQQAKNEHLTLQLERLQENLTKQEENSTRDKTEFSANEARFKEDISKLKENLAEEKNNLAKLEKSKNEEKHALDQKLTEEQEARRQVEKELRELQEKYTSLSYDLKNEQNKNEQLMLKIEQVEARANSLQETVVKTETESDKIERQLRDEIFKLKEELLEEKNNYQKLEKVKAEEKQHHEKLFAGEVDVRKRVEKELHDTTERLNNLGYMYQDEQIKTEALEEKIRQQETEHKSLQEVIVQNRQAAEAQENKYKEEVFQLKDTLLNEKNLYQKLNQAKLKVEKEILSTQKTFVSLKEENAYQKKITAGKESEIAVLTQERDQLRSGLQREQLVLTEMKQLLELEKSLRESEKKQAGLDLMRTEEKYRLDVGARDQAANKLQNNNASLSKEIEITKQSLEESKKEVKENSKKNAKLKMALDALQKEADELKAKVQEMADEKDQLIKTALNAQADQRKLRIIGDRFEGKTESFARLIYGDLSFSVMLKDCTKYSQVKKQGGKNKTKWQKRYLILNGNFLLYYASTDDKEPKGVVYLDNDSANVSKIDLSKNKVEQENAFTIVKKNTGRPFFFSCTTEEECTEWVKSLMLAVGYPPDEVNAYLQMEVGSRASLRGASVVRKRAVGTAPSKS